MFSNDSYPLAILRPPESLSDSLVDIVSFDKGILPFVVSLVLFRNPLSFLAPPFLPRFGLGRSLSEPNINNIKIKMSFFS